MPKPKKRTFAEEQAAFEAAKKRQAERDALKAAGKTPTPQQQRTAKAAKKRQTIIKNVPGTTGLQALQKALAPKSPQKKKR